MESDAENAEVPNSFFVWQASLSASDGVLPNILAAPVTDSQTLTELSVSLQDVQRALHGLDARIAESTWIRRHTVPACLSRYLLNWKPKAPCVHHIFSVSIHTATVPTEWKSATVRPIYKERGSKHVATNYRPISLLSALLKCLEKLIFRRLYSHLHPFLPTMVTSLASGRKTQRPTNLPAWFTDLRQPLMKATPPWHASMTYPRHLIEYGTAVSWLSSTTLVYEANPTPG